MRSYPSVNVIVSVLYQEYIQVNPLSIEFHIISKALCRLSFKMLEGKTSQPTTLEVPFSRNSNSVYVHIRLPESYVSIKSQAQMCVCIRLLSYECKVIMNKIMKVFIRFFYLNQWWGEELLLKSSELAPGARISFLNMYILAI